MKKVYILLILLFTLLISSCSPKAEKDTVKISKGSVCLTYGKTGFTKKAPAPDGEFEIVLKDVTGDKEDDVILTGKSGFFIYDFKAVPRKIRDSGEMFLSAKKGGEGAVVFINTGQNFSVEGEFENFTFSKPYGLKISDCDGDGTEEISYSVKLEDTVFSVTEKYGQGGFHISEIIY